VKECRLSKFNGGTDSLIDRKGMALVLVSLSEEQPGKVGIEGIVNLLLLVGRQWSCEQKAKEATYQVHSDAAAS
jgi:hypothetical protein